MLRMEQIGKTYRLGDVVVPRVDSKCVTNAQA
jgi:hypothetical protein